jgi:hypothetical protein
VQGIPPLAADPVRTAAARDADNQQIGDRLSWR